MYAKGCPVILQRDLLYRVETTTETTTTPEGTAHSIIFCFVLLVLLAAVECLKSVLLAACVREFY